MDIQCTIVGTSPLMLHRFNEESALAVENKARKVNTVKDLTPEEQAKRFLYIGTQPDTKGKLVLPAQNFHRAVIEAGRYHKIGKKQLTTSTSSIVAPLLRPYEFEFILSPQKWVTDSRPVVNQAVGARRMAHRPRFDKWSFTCLLFVDDDELGFDLARALVDDAGRKVGIGVMRPERKGGLGCFRVDEWKRV